MGTTETQIEPRSREVTLSASGGTYDISGTDCIIFGELLSDTRQWFRVFYETGLEPTVYTTTSLDVRATNLSLKLCAIDNAGSLRLINNTASSKSLRITRER